MCRYTGWWCGVESGHGGCPGGLITVHTLQSVRIRVSGAPPRQTWEARVLLGSSPSGRARTLSAGCDWQGAAVAQRMECARKRLPAEYEYRFVER